MSKYIIDVGEAYVEYICGKGDMLCLPVRINEFEDNWLNTNIPLTPYTELDTEKIREESFKNGYDAACKDIDIKSKTNAAYQQGRKDGKIEGQVEAWVCAKKIVLNKARKGFSYMELETIFGTAEMIEIFDMSASDVIEKIRQYEQEKKEHSIKYDQIRQGLLNVAKACNAKAAELSEVLAKMKETE